MMHTPYCTSILSLRSYTCFNDYSCYYSNQRCPSTYCSCCFSLPINSCKLYPNPSFLYGLRQSTLIQCPPSRRFLVGSTDRYCSRSSVYHVGPCCCFESSCVKRERVERDRRNRCENKCCCINDRNSLGVNNVKGRMMSRPQPRLRPRRNLRVYAVDGDAEDVNIVKDRMMSRPWPRRNMRVYAVGDTDAMLSLLSEEIVEECVVFREKNKRVNQGGGVVSKQNVVIEELRDGNEGVGSGYREETKSKNRVKSSRDKSRDEGRRRREERYDISKEEDQRLRRRESGSSYYSVSDSREFGSDIEVEIEQEQEREQFVGESSTSHQKDLRKSGGVVITEQVKQDWEKYRDDKYQELQSSRRDDHRVSGSIQQNWRKKSEKKLTEESEESSLRNESPVLSQSQLSQAKESCAMIGSSSKKQFDFQENQAISDLKSHEQPSARIQKDNRASEYLKSSIQHDDLTQKRRESIETTSTAWRSSRRKEDSEIIDMPVVESGCEYCKTCGRSMEERNTKSDFQQKTEQSKINVDGRLTINAERLSENRQRRQEQGSSSLQSSVAEESKQHNQMQMVTGQASGKQKSQHHLEIISSSDTSAQSTVREEQSETRMQSIAESSGISADSQFESRRRKEDTGTSSIRSSSKEEKRLHDQLYLEIDQVDARRKSQHYSETMGVGGSFSRSNLSSQQQSEIRMKHSGEKTMSLSAAEELQRSREESSKVYHTEMGQTRVHSSDLEINNQSISNKRVHDEQTYSKTKVQSIEEIVEKRKRIEETIVQSTLRTEVRGPSPGHSSGEATISQPFTPSISQSGAQESSGQETKREHLLLTYPTYQYESQFHQASSSGMQNDMGGIIEVGSGSTQLHPQARSSSSFSDVDEDKSEQLLLTYPTYQYESQFHEASDTGMRKDMGRIMEVGSSSTQIHPQARKSSSFSKVDDMREQLSVCEASGSGMRNDMGRIIELGSGSTQIYPQARTPSSYSEVDDNNRKFSEENSPEGVLASAARMQESSTLIIGEFVEQMSHEPSTLNTTSEKRFSKQYLKYPDEKKLRISSQSDIGRTGLHNEGSASELSPRVSTPDSEKKRSQIQDSKHSSSDSFTKGSSDQMWDVKDLFVQEASEMESSDAAKSETVVSVRTGKFLWNIVAGICRLRWGSLSEKQKSTVKKQISPTGSAGGETWFSGDEADEANGSGSGNGNGTEAEKITLLQESTSDQSLLRSTTRRKEDVVMSLGDKLSVVDGGASSSSSALQGSSMSGGALVESAELNIPQLTSILSPLVGLSIPSARELRRSLALEELDDEETKETPVSSLEEQRDYFHERQSDVSPSEGTDISPSEGGIETDSKKRLQRSKLVLQRYDEWEDAYRREREQRKVDEIFMREALSEAIKAADSWEVPVGAVLVQNEKIIARGYNLVEELRDSTAHAEMICIREASNVLHTWRLSDTTLYVTLEPCPMCAGAILQARISTLVWGAPNKLLGADGSWIRLFPEGMEGDERSEVMEKPAAPVHPFHPKMNIRRGILQEECADIMQQFFQLKRRKAKPKAEPSEEPDQPTCFPKPKSKHKSKLLHKMHNVFHPSNPSVD